MSLNSVRLDAVRAAVVIVFAGAITAMPSQARAQAEARFVTGPLAWTPTFQLREAGVDSNVFNTSSDPKEDVVGTASSQVSSVLTLGLLQAATQGRAEYMYFERYAKERSINGQVSSHVDFPLTRFSPDVTVSWAHLKERSGNEIDTRAPRTDFGYAAGLQTKVTPRVEITVTGGKQTITYDKGFAFRGVEIASQLDRETLTGMAAARFALTPFTSLTLDASLSRDQFPFRPYAETDNVRGNVGFEFAPDAVIHGKAVVGYHSLQPYYRRVSNATMSAFQGFTSATEIGYTLLDVTRLTGRFSRDANYSISTSQPLYVSTGGGLDVVQTLFGPVDLDVRASREHLKYEETVVEQAHTDVADILGGGFLIRVGSGAVIELMYDNTERRSTAGRDFEFTRRRIYTTVTYGF